MPLKNFVKGLEAIVLSGAVLFNSFFCQNLLAEEAETKSENKPKTIQVWAGWIDIQPKAKGLYTVREILGEMVIFPLREASYPSEDVNYWIKENKEISPFEAVGQYIRVTDPNYKITYTIMLRTVYTEMPKWAEGKIIEGYKSYTLFTDETKDVFSTIANSKLKKRSDKKVVWELSPAEGGRLVFGRSIRGGEEKNIENNWRFNIVGPGTKYSNIGKENEPTPSDYHIQDYMGTVVNIYGLNFDGGLF